jgi:hypothetical protein
MVSIKDFRIKQGLTQQQLHGWMECEITIYPTYVPIVLVDIVELGYNLFLLSNNLL